MNKKYIISYVSKIRKKAGKFIKKELKKHGINDLSVSHGSILSVLYENNDKLTMKKIANLINRDKSTVNKKNKKLEKLGYIKRIKCQQDKRITFISLTQKGLDIQNIFDLISKKLIATAYNDFSKQEEQMLLNLLKKMNNNFNSINKS